MLQILEQNPTWTITFVVALVAALVAVVVHVVGRAVLHRVTRHSIVLQAMLKQTERAGAVALPLLAMQVVWGSAPDNLQFIGLVRHVNGLLLLAAATWLAIQAVGGLAEGVIARHPIYIEDNLQARRIATQTRVLSRSAMVLLLIAGVAMALMTFPGARQLGASLLASAGVLGIVGGLAARPVFANLIAGLQLALAQPIRIDDVLIVQGEWGRVEEITGTYVVLKIWDERRMIIPLQWFIENPFQNWTRTGANILGTVFLYLDYATPIAPLRAEAERLVKTFPEWDERVFAVQVTDAKERTIEVRVLVSASNSGKAFDLRCKMREALLAFLAREHPQALPQVRVQGAEAPAIAGA
ncbi:mechanosensitive ion channel [Ramlibacter sp. USB13]|uniref:Mechanosensitive ion channel n=1 Tax=Ramlibacter cellulosilyticus TaxID=2764187 RepID=A0A923MMM8_9BURK|nr:mechanosensitive ion channel domain-containing protein [Ramlibacter cellulosilyticus]MBC5782150.1 mechanosensitive ion channel [Ramlibacter cellulosilyticus]